MTLPQASGGKAEFVKRLTDTLGSQAALVESQRFDHSAFFV